MKKLTQKFLSAFICLAFTGLQMSFADVLQTGMFADKNVLTGAQIKGHTAGLTKIETDAALNNATLHFSNHTRIDWNTLNVYKNQSLYFKNGNYGVLNNVVGTSISKFAGTIKADSGKIIISNPNGILFEGGKFESLGGLVLSTKDLTALQIDDTTDFDSLDLDSASYGDAVAIVAIADSSNIAAADINIISQGIFVDSSTLSSSNANGIVLSTTDGANFVASHTMTADDGSTKTITFSGNYSNSIANSAITTADGSLKLTSDNGILVRNNEVTGNVTANAAGNVWTNSAISGNAEITSSNGQVTLDTAEVGGNLSINANTYNYIYDSVIGGTSDITASYIYIEGTTFKGAANLTDNTSNKYGIYFIKSNIEDKLTINSKDFIRIDNSTLSDLEITTDSYVRMLNDTMGNTTITTKDNEYIRIGGDIVVNGDMTLKSGYIGMGYYETNGTLTSGSINITGDLNATSKNAIGYSNEISAKNITLTSTESCIIAASSENATGSLHADGTITLTADKGEIVSLNGDAVDGTSDYYGFMTTSGTVTPEMMADKDKGRVILTGGSAVLSSLGSVVTDVDLTGDLTINTELDARVLGNVGNDLDVNSRYVYLEQTVVGNNADINSAYTYVNEATVANNLTLIDSVADGYGTHVYNSEIGGKLTIESPDRVNITIAQADEAVITAGDTIRVLDMTTNGDMTITATDNSSVRIGGTNSVGGDLTIDSSYLYLGYFETNAVLSEGSLNVAGDLTANVDKTIAYSDRITADSISLTSEKGSIVSAKSDITDGVLVSDNITLSAHNGVIAQLDGNAVNGTSDYYKAATSNYLTKDNIQDILGKTVDECGAIEVAAKTEDGDLNLTIDTSVINVNSDAGNTILNVTTDSLENLTLSSTGDITVSDITVTKPASDTDDVRGNVVLNSENGSITMENIIADNDITAKAGDSIYAGGLTADADNNGIGDITLEAKNIINLDGATGNNITTDSGVDSIIKNVTGADDVTITTGGNAVVENVIADGNKDGKGDLTINAGGNATVSGSEGENVKISADKDAEVTDVKGADDVEINAGGNVIADKIIADADNDGIGDLTINGQGNVKVENSEGQNVDITSGVDAIVNNVTGADDVTINAGNDVTGSNLIADGNEDGIGDLTINAGGNINIDGGKGENVTINGKGEDSDVDVDNITAGNDVDIDAGHDVNADNVKADNDINIDAGNDVTGSDLIADADKDGEGDLNINAGGNIKVDGGEGENVTINGKGEDSDVDVDNITAGNDVDIDAGHDVNADNVKADNDINIDAGNDVTGSDLIADADKDGEGDLNINAGGNIKVDGGEGENVDINAGNDVDVDNITAGNDVDIDAGHDVNADDVKADNDINIDAGNDVTGSDLIADADKDGEGDLNINAGGNIKVDGGEGENVNINGNGDDSDVDVKDITAGNDVDIDAGHDVNAEDVKADNDINIDAGNDVTGKDLIADADNDGEGDLNINAGGNVDIDGGSGKNVDIDSGNDTNVDNITAGDDINIDAGGDVTGDNLKADDDNDGKGSININAGGSVNIGDTNGSKVFVNGIDIGDNSIASEVLKNLNNLSQSGVNTAMAQSFTPIAFAAEDDDDEQSVLAKKIAKTVFRTEDGTVSITDRFNTVK